MEWTFFIAAHMVLSFRSVNEIVQITHQCFTEQCLQSIETFFVSHCAHPLHSLRSRLGMSEGWDGRETRQPTPTYQEHIPYHVASCSAINLGSTCSRVAIHSETVWAFSQLVGHGDWLPLLHLFVFLLFSFLLLLNHLYLDPWVFLTVSLLLIPPCGWWWGVSEQLVTA